MNVIKLSQTYKSENSDKCVAVEYPHKDKDIDFATAVISGKYPEEGYCVNLEVKEMIYVISGGAS